MDRDRARPGQQLIAGQLKAEHHKVAPGHVTLSFSDGAAATVT